MTIEGYQKENIELKKKIAILESERDILKAKLNFALGCFDELKAGLEKVIDSTEMAKDGIT